MNKSERNAIYRKAKILYKRADHYRKINKKKNEEFLKKSYFKLMEGFSEESEINKKLFHNENTKVFLNSVFRWGKKLYVNHKFQSFYHFYIYMVVANTKIDLPSLLVKISEKKAELSIQKIMFEEAISKNNTKQADQIIDKIKEGTMYLSAYEHIKKRKEYFSKFRKISILVLIPTIATCLTAILVPIYV